MRQRVQRISLVSFAGLVLVSAGLAVLIHWVSPLRDPSFEVNSANAGTLVPWLQWVTETAWLWASFTLAVLLTVSLTWVLTQRVQAPQPPRHRGVRWVATALYWTGFAACLFTVLQMLFLGYLLAQHIVD